MPYEEMDFDYILSHTDKPIFLLQKGKFIRFNKALLKLLGYDNEEALIGKTPMDISPEFQQSGQKSEKLGIEKLKDVINNSGNVFEWIHTKYDGSEVFVRVSMTKIEHEKNDIILGVWDDITEEKRKEQQIIQTEKKFKKVFESMEEGMALCEMIYDKETALYYVILDVNSSFERILKVKKEDKIGKSPQFHLDTRKTPYLEIYDNVIKTKKPYKFEVYEEKYKMYFRISVFHTEGNMFATIFEDITEKKEQEKKIAYLTYHDTLTGLYNRTYYEEVIKKLDTPENLPLSIMMIDVNGLKMTNDTFGHAFGDDILKSAAKKINRLVPQKFLTARIGGDEFAIIMPNTISAEAKKLMKEIESNNLEMVNGIEISLSAGIATKKYIIQNINQIIMLADQQMYKKKQKYGSDIRKKIIDKVLEKLDQEIPWEKEHRDNVIKWSLMIGQSMNLEKVEMSRLEKVAMLHNIGKVGIPKELLKKKEPLTDEEFEIIKTHTEIGYRLVRAVPDYAPIAEEVFHHHERPDGKGYPTGISKEEIPFLTRIITITCAYDDMVSYRPYKRALSKEEAIQELVKNSKKQFDEQIVSVFLELL